MSCDLCSLCDSSLRVRQMGNGKRNARIMVVQESPFEIESKRGSYMLGKSGRLFTSALGEVGIDVDDVYYTALVKCSTPEDRLPTPKEIKACEDYLRAEIEVIDPEIIIPLGAGPLKVLCGLTGVTKHRGRLIEKDGHKFFPIIPPNMVLKQPKHMEFFTKDMINLHSILEGETPEGIVNFKVEYRFGETYEDVIKELNRLRELPSGSDIVFDLETIKTNPFIPKVDAGVKTSKEFPESLKPKIVAVGLTDKSGYGFAFPLYHRQTPFTGNQLGTIVKTMRDLFGREDLVFTGHHGKFDVKWLRENLAVDVPGFLWDTMLLHYLGVTEEKGTHGLKQLAWLETDMGGYDDALDKVAPKGKDEGNYDLIDWDVLKQYLCGDVDCTFRLLEKYRPLITGDEKLHWLWKEIIHPGNLALMDMEMNGAYVDTEWLSKLEESYPKEIDRLEDKLRQYPEVLEMERECRDKWEQRVAIGEIPRAQRTPEQQKNFEVWNKYNPSKGGDKFNFGSTKQLQELFFERMGLTTVVLTDKGAPSTNDDSMKYMKNQHPMCELLLEYRKVRHLYNNFVVPMRDMISEKSRIHGTYNIHGTVTGRLSSNNPNMQQMPRHVYNPLLFQYHNEIKSLFSSEWGTDGCILQIDYSQLELRILGVVTGDTELIRLYKEGADLHKEVASSAFGVPVSEVTKEQRTSAKKIQFGIVYQESPRGLSEDLRSEGIDLSKEDCEGFIANYFKRFPKVEKWIRQTKKFAKRHKYVQTIFGRIRHLDGIASTDSSIAGECERQSVNFPIQSSGSDCTVQAIIQINKWLKENNMKSKLIVTVHDSIVADTPFEETLVVAEKMKHVMENLSEYHDDYHILGGMPLLAELEIGYDYGHSFECSLDELKENGAKAYIDRMLVESHDQANDTYKKILEEGGALPPYVDYTV